ncbi:hypothetical protein ABDK75_10440 [Gluconobacter sp. OJA]|uniref:hypothetical protein n=1 Tax=Gluconobacter sp. OJA TaxID=3145197 RepID=UPI0031F86FEA
MSEFQIGRLFVVERLQSVRLTQIFKFADNILGYIISATVSSNGSSGYDIGGSDDKGCFNFIVRMWFPEVQVICHKYSFLGPVGAARMEGVGERIKRFSHTADLPLEMGAVL